MANHSASNVRFVDTDDTTLGTRIGIVGIKYIAGGGSTSVIIRDENSSGDILWTEDGSADKFEEVRIEATKGIHITIADSASVYIYLR